MTSIPETFQEGGMPQRKGLVAHSPSGEYGKVLQQPEVDPPVAGEGAVHPGHDRGHDQI